MSNLNLSNKTFFSYTIQDETFTTKTHQDNFLLFQNTSTKSASPISEKRYNEESSIFKKSDEASEDSDEEYEPCKKDLCYNTEKVFEKNRDLVKPIEKTDEIFEFIEKKDESDRKSMKKQMVFEVRQQSHRKNISDSDSVIYMGSEEEKYFRDSRLQPPIYVSDIKNRDSMPFLENSPCMAYCKHCRKDVHTSLEIQSPHFSTGILQIFTSLFSCCSLPTWLGNLRVHKCPVCSSVIGKCN
ncbi:hypothetical protein SteCoe_33173 [Stentor coeruleus]|uniref:Uncharacterized protein n=1 Tax=Stentor coeruleus TaxID=5963 RepID=A0A1R2AXC6_9CILI|nr:hypothetical protein SteCoe_33173 [Stentor coeruleus]